MMSSHPRRLGRLQPGLLAPRFGAPLLARAGSRFTVESIEAPEPAAAPVEAALLSAADAQHFPLSVLTTTSTKMEQGLCLVKRVVCAPDAPPDGYDLRLRRAGGEPELAPRSVWLRKEAPTTPGALQLAHLTAHSGSTAQPAAHFSHLAPRHYARFSLHRRQTVYRFCHPLARRVPPSRAPHEDEHVSHVIRRHHAQPLRTP